MVNGESLLLQLLISNLIENAIKYSADAVEIIVKLENSAKKIVLSIADFGIGISDKEKKAVFEKFYRSGNENKRKTKGTGLGLYLCKKIILFHSGNISVKDNQPNGSIFTVTFDALC